jgi:hypothetical protein
MRTGARAGLASQGRVRPTLATDSIPPEEAQEDADRDAPSRVGGATRHELSEVRGVEVFQAPPRGPPGHPGLPIFLGVIPRKRGLLLGSARPPGDQHHRQTQHGSNQWLPPRGRPPLTRESSFADLRTVSDAHNSGDGHRPNDTAPQRSSHRGRTVASSRADGLSPTPGLSARSAARTAGSEEQPKEWDDQAGREPVDPQASPGPIDPARLRAPPPVEDQE